MRLLRAFGAALLLAFLAPLAVRAADRQDEADELYRRAVEYGSRNDVEGRRSAMRCLEQATLLVPENAGFQLALARVYYRMGFLKLARGRFQRVERLQPTNADARMGLGWVWRRDWLKYLDRVSLARAIDNFDRAARLEPGRADAWLQLVPLLVEKPDLPGAIAAAERALAADRTRPEALLALAHASFRLGRVERADSAFRLVVPRLPKIIRNRYLDIAPVASEADTAVYNRLPAAEKERFSRRFWKENDPDLASPENEAQLEYWSRVTQAYFLYFDPHRQEWDQRGEVYVRYGPPEKAEYNPVGASNVLRVSSFGVTRSNGLFPMNTLLWSYPGLGMAVSMEDRLLSEYYLRPISLTRDMDPVPDADSLARREDALATSSGRGVFPRLPPGATKLPIDGVLARFVGDRDPRLLALLETPGAPGDSLTGEWVVIDTAGVEVRRERRALDPSPCDPAGHRIADFASDLPAGEYTAGLSVRDGRGGRGVMRERVSIAPVATTLELSDVVVSCGAPAVEPGVAGAAPAVRLSPNPGARVTGDDPLLVYFEMYHLATGDDGVAQIEFEYTVRSAERDRRIWVQRLFQPRKPLPEVSARRREDQPGTLRRQFVTIPVQSLPPGRYRLDIRVRDLGALVERGAEATFVKGGPARVGS